MDDVHVTNMAYGREDGGSSPTWLGGSWPELLTGGVEGPQLGRLQRRRAAGLLSSSVNYHIHDEVQCAVKLQVCGIQSSTERYYVAFGILLYISFYWRLG